MANGSGSHAKLNNGLPFRDGTTHDQMIVMMGYFANRGAPDLVEYMDYSGRITICGKFSEDIDGVDGVAINHILSRSTDVKFYRVWFGDTSTKEAIERTFDYEGLEIKWSAPHRDRYWNNKPQGRADTYISITIGDGPTSGLSNGQHLVSPIYGVWSTDDYDDDSIIKGGMRMLRDLDRDFPGAAALTLRFSYKGLKSNGEVTLPALKVVRWNEHIPHWEPITETTRPYGQSQIETETKMLCTWYALGVGF